MRVHILFIDRGLRHFSIDCRVVSLSLYSAHVQPGTLVVSLLESTDMVVRI